MPKIERAHTSGNVIVQPSISVDIAINGLGIPEPTVTPDIEGWNLATASYTGKSLLVSGQDTSPLGMYLKPNESILYLMGAANDKAYQYNILTPGDISTGSHVGTSVSVNPQEASPRDISVRPDGLKAYIYGDATNTMYQYSVTAGNINTLSYDSISKGGIFDALSRGFYFRPDGKMLYATGVSGVQISQYSMPTAWDITTLVSVGFIAVFSQTTTPKDMFFKSDGTKMYVLDGANQRVYQYTLSTPWLVSTATYDSVLKSVISEAGDVQAMSFNENGTNMLISDFTTKRIFQYSLTA